MRHVAVYHMLQRTSLMMPATQKQHFACSHHSAYAHGKRLLRHEVHIAVEEAAIGNDGVGSKSLDAGF